MQCRRWQRSVLQGLRLWRPAAVCSRSVSNLRQWPWSIHGSLEPRIRPADRMSGTLLAEVCQGQCVSQARIASCTNQSARPSCCVHARRQDARLLAINRRHQACTQPDSRGVRQALLIPLRWSICDQLPGER